MSHGPLSDLSNLTSRYATRTWFRVAGAVITLLVFSTGLTGFLICDSKENKLGLLGCIYATCKLFLFHGEAESLSWHHEPHYAVIFISIAAFLGPLLSAAVLVLLVGQVAARILDQQGVRVSGHAVILGCGREGIHWANYLDQKRRLQFGVANNKSEGPQLGWVRSTIKKLVNWANYQHAKRQFPIVVVNRNGEGPQLGRAREISKALLIGDMTDERTRERAAVLKSKMVVVCTGNELANIDTARATEEEAKKANLDGPMIFCRVVSQSLLFHMLRSAEDSSSRIRYFNIYDFVANDAIRATLERDARDKPARTDPSRVHLIICGFGRFGQAVLHAAGADRKLFNRLSAVDIVDLHADDLLDAYKFSAPEEDYRILNDLYRPLSEDPPAPARKKLTEACRFGILNNNLWATLLKKPAGALRLVFICTDNDVTNLEYALAIERLVKKKHQDIQAIVVMRQFERPQNKGDDIVYATMTQSTNSQIAELIAEATKRLTLIQPQ